MTDPVGPLNRAFEVLQRQIAEHARQLESGTRTQAPGSSGPAARPGAAGRADLGALRQRIVERLQAVDPKGPQAGRRRRRIFLESTLAWEFGEDALRDPGFQELLDRLEATLAEHPDIERQFQLALGKA
ncbi:MAG TPA: hypothetical protein VFV71_08825 [Burkholderiales bacterium]|nr:hypothetical protein [Burkholderiales bacterium]